MRNLIKRLVAWSERKWPDKVVVTQEKYESLEKEIMTQLQDIQRLTEAMAQHAIKLNTLPDFGAFEERLKKTESVVLMHSQAMGFAQRPDMSLER